MSYQQSLFKKHHIPESIQPYLALPKLIPISQNQKLFHKFQQIWDNKQIDEQHLQLSQKCKEVYNGFLHAFRYYQNPKNFKFKLIDSKFQPVPKGHRNNVSYACQIRTYEQDTFKDKLSQLQVSQIQQTGTFEVNSQNRLITLPYVWQINTKLLLGLNKRIQIWRYALANIYQRFINAKQVILEQIPRTFFGLKQLPQRFFSTIFGCRSHQTIYQQNPEVEITKDFLEEVYQKIYCRQNDTQSWGKDFWIALFVHYDHRLDSPKYRKMTQEQRKQQEILKQKLKDKYHQASNKVSLLQQRLQSIDYSFSKHWGKNRKNVIKEIQTQFQEKPMQQEDQEKRLLDTIPDEYKEEKIIERLQEKKFTMYLEYINQNLSKQSINMKIITAIVILLRFFRIISIKESKFQKQRARIRNRISDEIKKQFPIRSLSYKFFQKKLQERIQPIQRAMQKEYEANFEKDFTSKQHQEIFQIFMTYKNNYPQKLLEKQKQQKKIVVPARIFRTTYMLLPPYEVQTYRDGNNNISGYGLIRERQMTIDTRNHFWKFKLYAMRLKSWTINCFVFCFFWSIVGPFGIKCLMPYKQFQYGESIDYQTGVKNSQGLQLTVRGQFQNVLKGIKASRQHFESLPDRGIFGKKFSRIYNYFQCYVLRLLISGILIVLILYPLAIILNVVISIVLILTVWLWVPMIMMITYLFNIFVFQFQVNVVSSELKIKSIPLLSIFFKILWVFILIVYMLIFSFIWTPIACVFVLLVHILRRGFRTLTDKIMLFLIKHLGRTPSRDTAIAWKISGPGMSKTYFMSIREDNLYVLIQAQLEKKLLQKINTSFYLIVKQNSNDYNDTMRRFLAPYSSNTYPDNFVISKNANELENNFQSQYYEFLNRYPSYPYNVRFTQQELDSYFQNTIKIVQSFIEKYKLEDWIFQQFNVLEGAYEQLTRKVWINIFSCGQEIFEPLEKIDKRFKLQDVVSHRDVLEKQAESVMCAIRGEVSLEKTVARVGNFKYTSIHADPTIQNISTLIQKNNVNKYKSCYGNFSKFFSEIFVPQMNIKQIRKYDKQCYEYNVESHPQALNL